MYALTLPNINTYVFTCHVSSEDFLPDDAWFFAVSFVRQECSAAPVRSSGVFLGLWPRYANRRDGCQNRHQVPVATHHQIGPFVAGRDVSKLVKLRIRQQST